MLTHKEWEPIVEYLTDRFRLVLPDLPLHGDSEHGHRHPYTPGWFADVLAGFAGEVLGPRPHLGGHGLGAEIVLTTHIANEAAVQDAIVTLRRMPVIKLLGPLDRVHNP